jgi:hypothetical protein
MTSRSGKCASGNAASMCITKPLLINRAMRQSGVRIRIIRRDDMYCPSCGISTTLELNYCNRCGASLNQASVTDKPRASGTIISLSIMITAITLGGLGIIFPALVELKRSGFSEGMMGMFMFFSFMIIAIIDVMLGWQLSRLLSAPRQPGHSAPSKRTTPTTGLSSPKQIGALHEPIPSVTENTTRKFEPAYREPRA